MYADLVARFESRLADPVSVQTETLRRIVRQLTPGRIGREGDFAALASVDGATLVDRFRSAVPLRDFEGLRPYIEPDPLQLAGETPLCLLRTSASTGRPKLIPYTPSYREAIRRAHDVFSAAVFRDSPELPLVAGQPPRGLGLYQLSTSDERAHGFFVDSYVSRLYDVALPEDPFFFAIERDICRIPQATERLLAMALFTAGCDLRALRATNPTTLLLLARVLADNTDRFLRALVDREHRPAGSGVIDPERLVRLQRLGRPITPRDLWPNLALLVTWRGGTCHLFEPHLRAAYGDEVRIRAPIFAASEGVVAIPLSDADLGGAPAVESSFFEFLPEPFDGSDTMLLHELEQGKRYELVLTSPTGMTRYRIGDLVAVDGIVGRTPTFHFLSRKGRTSSVTGEKLTELQVEEAVSSAAALVGVRPIHFLLSVEVEALPYYVLSVDLGPAPAPAAARLAEVVDVQLCRLNVEYQSKRSSDRLGPIRLRRARHGAFERLQASGLSGGGAANFKLSHLSSEPIHHQLEEAP